MCEEFKFTIVEGLKTSDLVPTDEEVKQFVDDLENGRAEWDWQGIAERAVERLQFLERLAAEERAATSEARSPVMGGHSVTVEPFYSLTASRDADKVKAAIVRKYGANWYNEPQYFLDLVAFVEALTD